MIIKEKIILASSSPRRIEILKNMGFEVVASSHKLDEEKVINEMMHLEPGELAERLSVLKAQSIKDDFPDNVIIGSDTIVVIGDKILGKPKDIDEARKFIKLLSGKTHSVISGYSILYQNTIVSGFVESFIKVKSISNVELDDFLRNNEILDAAGAYKIQEGFALYIEKIDGSWFNIVGLPISKIYDELKKICLPK